MAIYSSNTSTQPTRYSKIQPMCLLKWEAKYKYFELWLMVYAKY